MSDLMNETIRAAAKRLMETFAATEEWKHVALIILNEFGGGATRFAKIKPEHQQPVLNALDGAYIARTAIKGASARRGDADTAVPPKSKQNLRWLQSNWVWLVAAERFVRLHDGITWTARQFDSYFNNLVKKGSVSSALFATDSIRKFERQVFRPGAPILEGQNCNLWRPSPIIAQEGDTSLWDNHLEWLIPSERDRDMLLNWLAWVYQNQDRHPNYGLLLIGKTFGTGKSWIARVMEQLIGVTNTKRPKSSSLGGQFNGWAGQCKLCILEELMHVGRFEVANNLRDMITEDSFEVNIKHVPAYQIENYIAFFGLSNHPDALPLERGDRRWMVIESPITEADKVQKREQGYFQELFRALKDPAALAAIAHALQTRDLQGYEASGDAPMTEAKASMIDLNRPTLTAWLDDNRLNPPLNRSLVNIRADIVPLIPTDIMREQSSKRTDTAVAKFLRDELGGVNLGDHRVALVGQECMVKLWAINGSAESLGKLGPADRAKLYEEERNNPPPLAPDDDTWLGEGV